MKSTYIYPTLILQCFNFEVGKNQKLKYLWLLHIDHQTPTMVRRHRLKILYFSSLHSEELDGSTDTTIFDKSLSLLNQFWTFNSLVKIIKFAGWLENVSALNWTSCMLIWKNFWHRVFFSLITVSRIMSLLKWVKQIFV